MTRSGASLAVAGGRLLRARATSPQRWNRVHRANDGWLEAVHQTVGDGLFGGERLTTRINIGDDSRLAVRSLSALSLRGCGPAATVVRLTVAPGSAVIYLPGPLLPQRDSDTTHSVALNVQPGGVALVATVVLPGRTAMGEWAAFRQMRLRTVARYRAEVAFAEDATVTPEAASFAGPAMFAGATAAVTLLSLGDWPASRPDWWDQFFCDAQVVGGASTLRGGGAIARALCADLGSALTLIQSVEAASRSQ